MVVVVVVVVVVEVVLERVVGNVEVVVCEVLDVVEVTDFDVEVVVVEVDEEDTDDDDDDDEVDGLIASATTPKSLPVFVPNDRVAPDIELERRSYWA